MEQLPKEALYQILLNLSLKDLENDCRLNKRINSICKSKIFWINYGDKKYWLKLDNNMTIKEIRNRINKADYVLEEIRKNKLLITYDDYLFVIDNMNKKDIDKLLYGKIRAIINLTRGRNPPRSLGSVNYVGLTLEELIKQIKLPTLYTDGDKLMVLDFNSNFNFSAAERILSEHEFFEIFRISELEKLKIIRQLNL